ncbi:MAG: PilN domain-containing protein [Phycisphaerae bacterium]|nr:PilN domain-containing protein [Phycisphaerae bacterium]
MANDMNFLPEDYVQRKTQKRTNMICLVLFVLVVGAVGVGFWITNQRNAVMNQESSAINNKMTKASAALHTLDILEKKKNEMLAKAEVTQMLMEPVPRSLLVATLTNNLPEGVSLLDYDLSCKEVKQAKSAVSKTKSRRKENAKEVSTQAEIKKFQTVIRFTGISYSDQQVAQLVSNLKTSDLFSQVYLTYSEEHKIKKDDSEDEKVRKFNVVAILDPKAKASEDDVRWAQSQHIKSM